MRGLIFLIVIVGVIYAANCAIADSPGTVIAAQEYDYQGSGAMGNRIVLDNLDGKHFAWLNGDTYSYVKLVYYSFMDENDSLRFPGGIPVRMEGRDGFPTLGTTGGGRAGIAFHSIESELEDIFAIDAERGSGFFWHSLTPDDYPGHYQFHTPKLSIGSNDWIHVVLSEDQYQAGDNVSAGYTNSTDYGENWSDLDIVDTSFLTGNAFPISSLFDPKTAIVFAKSIIDSTEPNAHNNDIVYVESPDGEQWNFEDIVNITNYQWEDTIRACVDFDGFYDSDGYLHIIWAAGYWAEEGAISTDRCFLYHWSELTGITLVHNGWYPSYPGTWNRSISKPSLGTDAGNNLYALWTHFDTLDVSAGGYSNRELYISYSTDNGFTWVDPINVTNTSTPGCIPGDCDSDVFPFLAERVNEKLHLFYLNDNDAGYLVYDEGAQTENFFRYLAFPNPISTNIDPPDALPKELSLFQNYPNPFNNQTSIEFFLPNDEEISLEIYNILGQRAGKLYSNKMLKSGYHKYRLEC